MRLYLDIDGVLHPTGVLGTESTKVLSNGTVIGWFDGWFSFSRVLEETLLPYPEVEIFVISTWRFFWEEADPKDLKEFLGPLGHRFIRCVPNHIRGGRQECIKLDMYNDKYEGPWVVIDDSNPWEDYPDATKLVHVSSTLGISDPIKLTELVGHLDRGRKEKALNQVDAEVAASRHQDPWEGPEEIDPEIQCASCNGLGASIVTRSCKTSIGIVFEYCLTCLNCGTVSYH